MVTVSVGEESIQHLASERSHPDPQHRSAGLSGRRVDLALDITQDRPTTISDVLDEPALVTAAQRNPADFGPLYERYVDQIYRYAYRRVGNHADAEDVTAQTFQQALAALPTYEWRGAPFGAWLYRIARNIIIRRGQIVRRETTVEDLHAYAEDQADDHDPADIAVLNAASEEIRALLQGLPMDQQRAIVLKYSRGLSNREIADQMSRSEGAIKQLVHRAILRLREHVADDWQYAN